MEGCQAEVGPWSRGELGGQTAECPLGHWGGWQQRVWPPFCQDTGPGVPLGAAVLGSGLDKELGRAGLGKSQRIVGV